MELTFRQRSFLSKFLDLCRETREAFHYSVVAERLGLSKSTAYDMLRLLERKGMVTCEYVTPKKIPGPGRSSILFFPTPRARETFFHMAGGAAEEREWEEAKTVILSSLRKGKASDYHGLLRELAARIPETRSPLAYCAEVITALLLGLREARFRFSEHNPVNRLLETPVSKLGMSILGGLMLGLALANQVSQRFLGNIQEHVRRYEKSLNELSPESLSVLRRFTQEVVAILTARAR